MVFPQNLKIIVYCQTWNNSIHNSSYLFVINITTVLASVIFSWSISVYYSIFTWFTQTRVCCKKYHTNNYYKQNKIIVNVLSIVNLINGKLKNFQKLFPHWGEGCFDCRHEGLPPQFKRPLSTEFKKINKYSILVDLFESYKTYRIEYLSSLVVNLYVVAIKMETWYK